jgi:hypothetical protein
MEVSAVLVHQDREVFLAQSWVHLQERLPELGLGIREGLGMELTGGSRGDHRGWVAGSLIGRHQPRPSREGDRGRGDRDRRDRRGAGLVETLQFVSQGK